MAKIKINLKWITIETETTYRQLFVVAIFLIFTIEVLNMFTLKINRDFLQYGVVAISNMATGLLVHEATSTLKKRKRG